MERLGYSRGTAYRYLRELVATGLLTRVSGSLYALGPRIIALDYAIRKCDPVLHAGIQIMQGLRNKLQCDVLLTSFYEDCVVVTHHERSNDNITISFSRGQLMPLFRGAPSKAIVASLSISKQRKLFADRQSEISAAGMGSTWAEFRARLALIRKAKHVESFAELDPGNVGVAMPLDVEPAVNPSSLSLVFSTSRYEIVDKSLVLNVLEAATTTINGLAAKLQARQNATGEVFTQA